MQVKLIEFMGWANCIHMQQGDVRLIITTEVGPRIIGLFKGDSPNHMVVFPETAGQTGGAEWKGYGGHRLWHAPEKEGRTYCPDNSPVAYEADDNGVTVIQDTEPNTRLTKVMRIEIAESGKVTVTHRIQNDNEFAVELSVWALSMLDKGALLVVPQNNRYEKYTYNRTVSLWPYSDMSDSRVYWGKKYVALKQDTAIKHPFKLGMPVEQGYAVAFNHNQALLKSFEYFADCVYPSCEANFETYTNDAMLEMESLAPLTVIDPGECAEHIEEWLLLDNVAAPEFKNEKSIDTAVLAVLKAAKKQLKKK